MPFWAASSWSFSRGADIGSEILIRRQNPERCRGRRLDREDAGGQYIDYVLL